MNIATAVLNEIISANIPAEGASIGNENDKQTWRIDFKPEATPQHISQAQVIVDNFDIAFYEAIEQTNNQSIQEAKDKWKISSLKGKTPDEIYNLVQNRIDNWSSLTEAKNDLREWLPLMITALAWTVMKNEHTT